ncbi:MAG: nucleoside hydrolase [Anaerolineae bacterium]
MSQPILIDTDPGIDDAMAILFALCSPELEVRALTTVHGNADAVQTARNARQILELAGRSDIPVAMGAARPLIRPFAGVVKEVHGANGLGDVALPAPKMPLLDIPAACLIVQQVKAAPGELTILTLGPLTNLALALHLEPEIAHQVRGVVLMGGAAFCPGNVSPVAEANIYHDPEAARMVFEAPWPLTMVGLDITTQVVMDRAYLIELQRAGNRLTQFIAAITPCYIAYHEQRYQLDGFHVHDPSAVAYLVRPELFRTQEYYVQVETQGGCQGYTVVDRLGQYANGRNVRVCVGVDGAGVLELYKQRLMF